MNRPDQPTDLSSNDQITKQLLFLIERSIAGEVKDIGLLVEFSDGTIQTFNLEHIVNKLKTITKEK